MFGATYALAQKKVTAISVLKKIPLVGGFLSGIFKKRQKDGFKHFVNSACDTKSQYYKDPKRYPLVWKFARKQPMTAKEKFNFKKWLYGWTQNWSKLCKADVRKKCDQIRVIAEPKPKPLPIVHKISASYKPAATTKQTTKTRDITEAIPPSLASAIPKTSLYILIGAGAILLIFKLAKGGAR